MKTKLYDHIHGPANDVALKIKALSRLFLEYRPAGSFGDEDEVHAGIGLILEGIADEAQSVGRLLDTNSDLITSEIDWEAAPKLAELERKVTELRSQEREGEKSK